MKKAINDATPRAAPMGMRRIAGEPKSPPKISERTVVGSMVPAAASGREVDEAAASAAAAASDMISKDDDDDGVDNEVYD